MRPTTLYTQVFESPLGEILLAKKDAGLVWLQFVESKEDGMEALREQFPDVGIETPDKENFAKYEKALHNYWNRHNLCPQLPVNLQGSDFQKQVWAALMQLPAGELCSYTQLAAQLGKPTAARAVASACAANNIALLVPCHRVVRSDGNLAGFRWGLDRKQWLLQHEQGGLYFPATTEQTKGK